MKRQVLPIAFRRTKLLATSVLLVGCGQANQRPSSNAPAGTNAAPIQANGAAQVDRSRAQDLQAPPSPGEGLRMLGLTKTAQEVGIEASDEFPIVYGVLMEFRTQRVVATVPSLNDGTASLYTNSTYGILGGIGHGTVRTAAVSFVKAAATFVDDATPTSDFPYPEPGRVRFYLLTFSGVRVIDTDEATIETITNKYRTLFGEGHNVLTQLRLVTEK